MSAFVYMMRCSNNALYTGWTNDLAKRSATHIKGKGGKFTHAFAAQKMVYWEELVDKSAALKREYALKQLKKAEKEALVRNFQGKLSQKADN